MRKIVKNRDLVILGILTVVLCFFIGSYMSLPLLADFANCSSGGCTCRCVGVDCNCASGGGECDCWCQAGEYDWCFKK